MYVLTSYMHIFKVSMCCLCMQIRVPFTLSLQSSFLSTYEYAICTVFCMSVCTQVRATGKSKNLGSMYSVSTYVVIQGLILIPTGIYKLYIKFMYIVPGPQEGLKIRGCQYHWVGIICLPPLQVGLTDLPKSGGAMDEYIFRRT